MVSLLPPAGVQWRLTRVSGSDAGRLGTFYSMWVEDKAVCKVLQVSLHSPQPFESSCLSNQSNHVQF